MSEDTAPGKSALRKMISEARLLEIIPLSSVTIWRMIKRDEFPSPSFVTANRKLWFEDEVVRWQAEVDGRGRGRNASKNISAKSATAGAIASG
jgi:predicted DNA-binding transcriptional regulator AlpA